MITEGLSVNAKGQVGEAIVNVAKGLPEGKALPQKMRSYTINGRNRIADGVNGDKDNFTQLWEVKNVKILNGSHIQQIQDALDYIARAKKGPPPRNIEFELYIRGKRADIPTKIEGSMPAFLKANGIVPKYLEDFIP